MVKFSPDLSILTVYSLPLISTTLDLSPVMESTDPLRGGSELPEAAATELMTFVLG